MARWLLLSLLLVVTSLVSAQAPVPVTFAWDVDPYAASAEIERDGVTQACPFLELRPTEHRCTVAWPLGTATFRARMANATGEWGPWSPPLLGTVQQSGAPGPFTVQWHSPIALPEPEPPMAVEYGTHLTPQVVTFLPAGETETVAFDAGAQSNRALYVQVSWRDRDNDISGITYNGVSLTSLVAKTTQGIHASRMFRLVNPASGSNNLAVTMGVATNNSPAMIAAWVAYDVDQTTPNDTLVVAQGVASTANVASAVTVTSATGDRVLFAVSSWNLTANISATPTNYTERYDAPNSGGLSVTGGDAAGAASITGTATWSNGAYQVDWIAFGVNINAAPAAGGSLPPPPFNYAPFLVR